MAMTTAIGTGAPVARIAARLLTDLDGLAQRMSDLYIRLIPEYAALDRAEIDGQVRPVSRWVVEHFFERVAAGEDPTLDEVDGLRESGRRRLEMGVPLEPMLHAYRLAGRAVWEAVVAATNPGEEPALGELGVKWFGFMDEASSAAAAGYLEASHDRLREVDAHRRALLEALLSAEDSHELAAVGARFLTPVAPSYAPVVIDGPDVHARMDALAAALPAETVCGPWGEHVLVLLPGDAASAGLATLGTMANDLVVGWSVAMAPGSGLRTEVLDVVDAVSAARRRGHQKGVIGPTDLLVERVVLGRPQAAERLGQPARVLASADRGGALRVTLEAYLDCGSVPETAQRVYVHPNTVSYRLARVAALTGLDPRVPREAAVLVLALAALDLTAQEASDGNKP
jgi:hypothetical protein